MIKLPDSIKRVAVIAVPALLAMLLIRPAIAEINTILLVVLIEALAMGLSGLAAFAYTRIDFIKEGSHQALGYIFLGVHIATGLTVLGVYIAQFR